MGKHTQEPWHMALFDLDHDTWSIDHKGSSISIAPDIDKPDAARIVACVNALAGKNPAAVGELIEAANLVDEWLTTRFPKRALGRADDLQRIKLARRLRSALAALDKE